jgi:Type I restriction enzyme R protein N terminus (HSDR_N)/NACHT domain
VAFGCCAPNKQNKTHSDTMTDFWNDISGADLRVEANVELRFVIPMLRALGYQNDDIEAKYPVVFQEGRAGRKPEADFVCFNGPLHNRDTSLLVVEAKRPGEALPDGKAQGEAYAQNLRAPLLLLTNAETLEIWQLQKTQDSVRVFVAPIASLAAERGKIERLLGKEAVVDYCKSFGVKTILEASADYGRFETAELSRILRRERQEASIDRTLAQTQQGAQRSNLTSDRLLFALPSGAIVVAPSGHGKTTLCRRLIRQVIEERQRGSQPRLPFEVGIPELELSQVSAVDFIQQRLQAHCPGVTPASFAQMLREKGVAVFCDGFDRASPAFQRRVSVELSHLLRDYPSVQLFVFSRGSATPSLELPVLELQPLSEEQVREIEQRVLSEGSTSWYSITGMMSPTLRALCDNPLLLRQVLAHWKKHNDFPQDIELLFRSWLDNVLEGDTNDHVSATRREQALTLLARQAVASPISKTEALALLDENGIPIECFNELVGCDALIVDGSAVELRHEALADYLRATALASMNDGRLLKSLETLAMPADSFFPVLLISQLRTRELQLAFWKRLSEAGLGRYLDALRYRFDLSDELQRSEPATLSRHYLEELLDGIETPLGSFFPQLREAVMEGLTEDATATLAATGAVDLTAKGLGYKLHALEPGQEKVTVAAPTFPGVLRGVNLDLARYRIDSGRLLGMTLLREKLIEAITQQQLKGGPVWAAERLLGRVRYLAEEFGADLSINDDFDKLDAFLKPRSDQWVDNTSFSRGVRFSLQSLLDDIAILRANGQTALDAWWLRLGWDDQSQSQIDETVRQILNEEYRRLQIVYREIVEATFPIITDPESYFAALPVRWSFTVAESGRLPGHRSAVWRSSPVAHWDEAGSDVTFAEEGSMASELDWEAIKGSLSALGRARARIPHFTGSMAFLPRHDGRQWTGYFDGATPVTHQVCAWLKEEVERLFRALPGSDGAF